MPWSEFVKKVSQTTRTPETVDEYHKLPKSKQDEIKDIGGFVGGTLKDGRRIKANMVDRSILTLDMDYAKADVWSEIELFNTFTCCMYSTHKHTPESPRFRLIIPLKRDVSPEEYEAISRMVAAKINIDLFDDTTYQAERLMYWPSTPCDGEFVFQFQDGPLLDPDEILGKYKDWKDTSTWPVSSRQNEVVKKSVSKQSDPTTKEGIIGAFCRAYTISTAIEQFLSDVYEPSVMEGRFTYKQGSTFGGLVTYEDMFAYSHHATDPAGGKLSNAFDLVRLHLFGELDQEAVEGTPASRLPSFTAMKELARGDNAVKQQLIEEKMEIAKKAFEEIGEDEKWAERLEYQKNGTLKATIDNVRLVMENNPDLAGAIGYNEFSHRHELLKDLPWREKSTGNLWTDKDDAALRHYMERVYDISNSGKIMDALIISAEQHRFHPVKDYLNSLAWDGVIRVDTLLIDFFGAEDSEYTRAVTRKTMAAAVSRIFNPGCKFDFMLLLVGKQGLGKSYFLKKLGGEWFSDSLTTVVGKEAYEQLQGVWIIEVGELYATKKADQNAQKHFISKQVDIFREAYGRRTGVFPRQCVFIGTTNEYEPLRDATGGRRFWPVYVGPGKQSLWTDLNVDQIWAEAVQIYKAGEELYLKDALAEAAKVVQAQYTEESEKTGMILSYLDTLLPENWPEMDLGERRLYLTGDITGGEGIVRRTKVCALEVWCECFGGDPKSFSYGQAREIRSILDRVDGWTRSRGSLTFPIYGKQRAYQRA
jgi:predicted P-loop ATPase